MLYDKNSVEIFDEKRAYLTVKWIPSKIKINEKYGKETFNVEAYCDLHAHSVFSDGTDTPSQLLDKAEAAGLSAIALTDHNTVSGLPDFMEAAKGRNIRAVPGIEFSADYHGTELHILGLFVKPEYFDSITQLMEDYHQRKEQSNLELLDKLKNAGYVLDYDTIKARTPGGQVNRALIAAELTQLGYTPSIQAAFKQLLSPSCGYYIPPQRPKPEKIIRLIKSMGAVAVLAHPFLNLQEQQLRQFLQEAVSWGLDGMETLYSTYDEQTTLAAKQVADDFRLLPSGGSDYHGCNKPHIQIGVGQGNLSVPHGLMTALEKRSRKT